MVNICIEALIRLFFEIVRVLFGNVTLLSQGFGPYFDSELPALLSTLKWFFVFLIIAMLAKNNIIRSLIITGIPTLVGLLSFIPYVGNFLAVAAGIATARIVVIAWLFVLWSDDRIHWLLKLVATPGIMICAAICSVLPFVSILSNISYAFVMGYLPEVTAVISIAFVVVISVISPTFLCKSLNWALVAWEDVRYEGLVSAIFSSLIIIKNKVIKIKYKS